MNKIYRLVWNKSLNLWTVVSENARGVTKKRNVVTNISVKTVTSSGENYKQYQLKPSLIALTISSVFFGSSAFAATNTGGGAVSNSNGSSMAISPTAQQCGTGGEASVNGNGGTAVGCGNNISGTDTTLQQGLTNRRGTGTNNYPTGVTTVTGASTAVGKGNRITGAGGATVVGNSNISDGGNFHNVAIGQGNRTGGTAGYNTALGIGNEATGSNSSVAIGVDNRARGSTSISMGRGTWADANYSIAQGNTATVESTGVGGIAMGHSATVSGARGIAIGSSTATDNNNAPATAANAAGTDSVAVGSGANGTGNQTTAVGRQAKAIGDNSAAYGNQAEATGASSVAVGDGSKAQGANDITLGRNAATASGGSNNIAMGNGVTTGGTGQNVAIGSDGTTANSASADGGAVAIGRGQKARGDGAVAIGDPNTTNGNGAVAVGRNNTAAGDAAGNTAADGAVALGNENQAIGQGSVALGNSSRAEQAGSIALGDTANAKAARGIALGSNAVATNADDVALGAGSTTTAATGPAYRTGTPAPASVISAGTAGNERRIQNLSDGAADTDAVNVRQLRSVQDGVDQLGESTAGALGGGSTYDPTTGTVSNPTYNINGNNINNVGDALTELDKGWTLQSNGANAAAVKAGDTVDIGTADGEENLQVAKDGNDIKYSLNRDLKVDSVTAGDSVLNTDGLTIANGPSVTKNGIDAAGKTISNVAPGVAGTDAVNKDQLDQTSTELTDKGFGLTAQDGTTVQKKLGEAVDVIGADDNITTKVQDGKVAIELAKDLNVNSVTAGDSVLNTDGLTIANGPSVTKDGIDAAGKKVTNVAEGDINPDSKDAINGSQLANNAQSVADALGGGSSVNPDGTVSKPNYTVNGDSLNNVGDAITALDKGWTLQSNGANGAAVKAGDTVDIGTANGEENLQVTKDGNDIKYSLNRDLKVDSVTAGDSVLNTDGLTIANGPSVTKNGIDAAGKTISNVAPGVAGTDAVNKDQLDQTSTELTDKGFGLTAQDGTTVQKKLGEAVDVIGADDNIITKVQDGKVAIELAKDLNVNSVTAGDTTINNDGLTIANGPSVTKDGIDAAGKKVTNVAAGTVSADSTDAINGSQLHAQGEGVKNIIGGNTTYDPATGQYTNPDIGGTGENNINDAIGAVGDAAKAAKTTVKEGENIVVTESKNADGSTNYEVATAKDVKFDSVTATDDEGNETVLTATGTQVKDGEGNEAEYGAKGISLKDQDGNGTILNSGGLGFVDPMGNNIGPSITVKGIDAGNTVITGVAAGRVAADSQDAINGSQLKGVSDSVAKSIGGNTTVNPDGTITTSNIGGTGKDNINDAIGAVGDAAKAAKSTVSNKDGNISVNETTKPDGSRDYEVGLAKDIKVDSVTAGGTKVDGDGLHIDGGPSVTKDGIDAGDKKVTGVADGEIAKDSKDAVNGGQLHDVADSVKNVVGGNTTVNPDGTISTSDVGGTGHNNINDAIASVKQDAQAAKSTVSNKDGNIKVNETTKADGSKDYEVGLADKIKVKEVDADTVNAGQVTVAGDQGTTNITGGGVSITGPKGEAGPSMTTDGINAGGKKVTGIADGVIAKDSKEGINGGQLHQSYQDVGGALGGGAGYDPEKGWKGPTYNIAGSNYNNVGDALGALNQADQALDNRITNLGDQMQQAFYDTNRRIDDVEKKANAGVAAAIALEAAPFVAGKYTYAVGAAYHGGENAFGATLRKTADNGRWSLTGGVAAASQGDPSFRLGLSGVID